MTAENVWEEKGKSMSMNETPSGERLHIGIFGRSNAGKSSLINEITGTGSRYRIGSQGYDDRSGQKSNGTLASRTGRSDRYAGTG